MAATLAMKRITRERKILEKQNDDYIVLFDDENLFKFEAYVIGPSDTLYSHKFIKLQIEIPDQYPLIPPKVKFIQHSGGRIHPNLYTDGKVCLSILGTWQGEKWATAMTCETVLITIRSLLDNKPYTHEPHQADNPTYNKYVQYTTWRWLLLDYLQNEQQPKFKSFLQNYIAKHGDDMLRDLQRQSVQNDGVNEYRSPYARSTAYLNYPVLENDLRKAIEECRRATAVVIEDVDEEVTIVESRSNTIGNENILPSVENEVVSPYSTFTVPTTTRPAG